MPPHKKLKSDKIISPVPKSVIKIIKTDVIPYDIMIASNVSIDKLITRLGKYNLILPDESIESIKNGAIAHTIQLTNKGVVIYLPSLVSMGVIAHEVFHAVWMILRTMGVEPSEESNEIYAYLIEFYTNEIIKIIKQ